MLAYIYHTLSSFRSVFSRHRTWVIFIMIVLGFLGVTEMLGISSFCRFGALTSRDTTACCTSFAPPLGVSTTSCSTGWPLS